MNRKNGLARVSLDLDPEMLTRLKVLCALLGKSIRSVMIEGLEKHLEIIEKDLKVEIKTK